MPEYLLAVYMVDGAPVPSDEEMQQRFEAVDAFNAELKEQGVWVYANGLMPADVATVVDATAGDVVMTDGPFPEGKEHVGGFWIIKVPDLDAALEWAAKGSAACGHKVEVRPFQDVGD
jgi:hypothetical protein